MRCWPLALLLALLTSPALADEACPPGNLLAGRAPSKALKVTNAKRITDGVAPEDGDDWRTNLTAVLTGRTASATWDLGREVTVNSLLVQGDNNDTYQVEGSVDGLTFQPIWRVPAHPNPGMRIRLQQGLNATVRYLRVGDAQGDNAYSLGEVQAFCQHPATWPPPMERKTGTLPKTETSRKVRMSQGKMVLGILGGLAFLGLFLARRREDAMLDLIAPAAGAGSLLYAGWMVVQEANRRSSASDAFVWEKRGLVIAGVIAGAVGLLIVKRWLGKKPVARVAERGALSMLILAGAVTWVNFGTFHGSRVVHYWDSFHYYMGSKYFKETRYTGLYHCSAIGELDDGRRDEFKDRQLRDLRDNRLGPALPQLERQEECRQAFSPERWAAFREDLRLFRHHMGKSWWAKMFMDHGYNATPVWNMVGQYLANQDWRAHIPPEGKTTAPVDLAKLSPVERAAVNRDFREARIPAFEQRMYKLVLLDFLLYAGIFALLGWAFGLRTAALAMVVWGSGYPWAYFWTGGSFGRVPWFFMAVAGMCFMARGYKALGGAGITWAMLLRVFPGALIAGVSVKIAYNLVRHRVVSAGHRRLILGCTAALVALVGASLPAVGGFDAYSEFLGNSFKHKRTPLTNHMGLPTLLSWHPKRVARHTKDSKLDDPFAVWKQERQRTLKERRLLHAGLLVLFLGLLAYAGRRLNDWEVTSLSVLFMIGIFELTCYYYSFVVLLAPFVLRRWHYVAVYIAMPIVTQYLQHEIGWYDEQYTAETVAVLVPVLYFLGHAAWERFKGIERAPDALEPPTVEGAAPA
ncbi:MAG: hypothetical protein KC613_01520 [Myxococcales bacterium]|nr:hypothetical protein [Myxococcales bacterium]